MRRPPKRNDLSLLEILASDDNIISDLNANLDEGYMSRFNALNTLFKDEPDWVREMTLKAVFSENGSDGEKEYKKELEEARFRTHPYIEGMNYYEY